MRFYLFLLVIAVIGCRSVKDYPQKSYNIVQESFHGQTINDPFKHLETDSITGEYLAWIETEAIEVKAKFRKLVPNLIPNKIDTNSVSFFRSSIDKKGQYWYLKEHKELLTVGLYFRKSIDADEQLIIDPSVIGEKYSINYYRFSWDRKYIAVGLTEGDKEFSNIKVFDLELMKFTEGHAPNSYPNALGGIEWLPDNSGFLYTYIPVIDQTKKGFLYNSKIKHFDIEQKIVLDRDLFSSASKDSSLFKEQSFPISYILESNKNLVIASVANQSSYRNTYIAKTVDFLNVAPVWQPLFTADDKITNIDSDSTYFYFQSSKRNSNFELCRTKITNPNFEDPEIIFSPEEAIFEDYVITEDGIFITTSKNGVNFDLFNLKNQKLNKIELPHSAGYLGLNSLTSDDPELWVSISGWTSESTRYSYNFKNNSFTNVDLNRKHLKNIKDVHVQEIEISGHDGIKIPISIIQPINSLNNSQQRVLLTAYGAFGLSYEAFIDSYIESWIAHGGTYVFAHVRGGGEKGEEWHTMGMKEFKENSWLDVISTAEYLIENNFTTQDLISVRGESAGGISVGMAVITRPDLFGAAAFRVCVFNTSRSEFGKTGKNGIQEFGTREKKEDFINLLKMDPYENIKENVNYPSMYITAGRNDARLSAWHSTKFAAKLKSRKAQKNEILLNIHDKGHGWEVDSEFTKNEVDEIISFLLSKTGHPDFQ